MNRYLTIPFKSLLFAWFSYLVWSEKEGEDGEDGEDKVDGKKGANDAEEDVALDKGEIHYYYYAKGARTLKVEEGCSRNRSNEN